ncbi:hypothetical protein ACR820_34220 [Streptomyces netropsis]
MLSPKAAAPAVQEDEAQAELAGRENLPLEPRQEMPVQAHVEFLEGETTLATNVVDSFGQPAAEWTALTCSSATLRLTSSTSLMTGSP